MTAPNSGRSAGSVGQWRQLTRAIDQYFELTKRGSSFRTEALAGVSTFAALAYIVVVNPSILAQAGIGWRAAFFATVLVSALGTILMGMWARLPFCLAPGMEMNAYFAYYVVGKLGLGPHKALGAVFFSGLLFLAASASGLRDKVLSSIPPQMKSALALSVGLFIALVACKISGVLKFDGLRIIGGGSVTSPAALSLYASLAIVLAFDRLKLPAGVLVSVIAPAIVLNASSAASSVVHPIASGGPFDGVGLADLSVVLAPQVWSVVLTLFLIDFYGSIAKLIGLSAATSLQTEGALPGLRPALLVDSGSTVAGAVLGTSNITVFVESGVGIAAGGRTGLTAIVCGLCLLACFGLAPFLGYLPVTATSGALIFVAISLCPRPRELMRMEPFDLFTLAAMLAAVLWSAAIDKAVFVGAVLFSARAILQRERPNPYLLSSALFLGADYAVQAALT